MRVRVLDVFGLEIRAERVIEDLDEIIKRTRLPGAEVIDAALQGFERAQTTVHDVLHINEIALLFAVLEDARALTGGHLPRQVIDHARRHPFVRFARAVDVKKAQPDDHPIGLFISRATRDVVHDRLRKRVDV